MNIEIFLYMNMFFVDYLLFCHWLVYKIIKDRKLIPNCFRSRSHHLAPSGQWSAMPLRMYTFPSSFRPHTASSHTLIHTNMPFGGLCSVLIFFLVGVNVNISPFGCWAQIKPKKNQKDVLTFVASNYNLLKIIIQVFFHF